MLWFLWFSSGVDQDSIRTSYKRLALKWHPDKHTGSSEALKVTLFSTSIPYPTQPNYHTVLLVVPPAYKVFRGV